MHEVAGAIEGVLSRDSFSCESADEACAGYICLGCLQNAA